MSREDKRIIYVALAVVAVIVGGVLWNGYKDRQVEEAIAGRVAAEIKVVQAAERIAARDKTVDSTDKEMLVLKTVIEFQKNNPEIIIKDNDKIHMDINKLDAFNAIRLFTDNVSEYDRERERYALHRFLGKDK